MAKRIEFIAPVEAMRGNLSGNQKLLYAENNNPAYDSPVGSINYARNYQPRFVGAKLSANNLKYFAVRTKSAVNLTPNAKFAMALMGASGAIYAAMKKSATIWAQLVAAYVAYKGNGGTYSIRQYATRSLMAGLRVKQADLYLSYGSATLVIKNPWYDGSQTAGIEVSQAILVKFWTELANNGITFVVGGRTGIANTGDTFEGLNAKNINVLNIDAYDDEAIAFKRTVGSVSYACFILDSAGSRIESSAVIVSGAVYGASAEFQLS